MFCYIHIPFCQSRCKYCRFSTFVWKADLDKEIYVDYLVKNIENNVIASDNEAIQKMWNNILNGLFHTSQWQNREWHNLLNSIYFWWWTPTSLSNSQLERIIIALKNRFGFDEKIEITLESTIQNITRENLIIWQKIWINRLSIWIQTLNNESLKEIWRPSRKEIINKLNIIENLFRKKCHSLEEGNLPYICFNWISISLDFIIGLPYVKKWELSQDLKFILEKYDFVNHISLYMLEEYYSYPQKWQEISIIEEDYLEEYLLCKNYLEENSFYRYELSNFAKPWFECKHNKSYWDHSEVIAFWLWSHWFLDWARYAYPDNFVDYYSGKLDYKENLTKDDLFLEKVMFGLRTSWITEVIYKKLNQEKIKYFVEQKLLDFQDDKLILWDKWVIFVDYIIKEIV